jgi:hypothetical protein
MQSVENPMCYSAQIWADFRKYERFGGKIQRQEIHQACRLDEEKGQLGESHALRHDGRYERLAGHMPLDVIDPTDTRRSLTGSEFMAPGDEQDEAD